MKTTLNYFYFNTDKPDELNQWSELKQTLKKRGYKLFDVISVSNHSDKEKFFDKVKEIKTFEIDTDYLFDNQLNTEASEGHKNGFRLHFFYQEIYPNKKIKEGYYLDLPDEYFQLLNRTYKCNYCGKQYDSKEMKHSDHMFCTSCLGSEFLKESDLKLLHLQKLTDKKVDNIVIPDWLVKVYKETQKTARLKRLEKRNNAKLNQLKNDIKTAKIEYNIFKWLIDKNISIDNVIYYKHNNTLSFNWMGSRDKMTEQDFDLFCESITERDLQNVLPKNISFELKGVKEFSN